MDEKKLFRKAVKARENSYCPYSGYAVGAALLAADGRVFTGCNIENASYTPTVCAERCAVFKAVSEGVREFTAIAIVGGPAKSETLSIAYPCGVCRQVLSEFCDTASFRVIVGKSEEELQVYTLAELLPHGFDKSELK